VDSVGNLTVTEKNELREWVASGNSAYDNPYYLCDERGCPLDFISAVRLTAEFVAEFTDSSQMWLEDAECKVNDKLPF